MIFVCAPLFLLFPTEIFIFIIYLFINFSFKVWVLDATPGKVRPGGDGEDHPAELISFLSILPKEVIV